MKTVIIIIQIIFAVLLTTAILIQAKGAGLDSAWSGGVYRSKRGVEKVFFFATIVLAIIFLLLSIVSAFLAKWEI